MRVEEIPVAGYETVVRGLDEASGLHALVAVHDTTLGPSLGGMRMLPYSSEDEALTDVLRLARGMTYKSAVASTGLGGGKSVVIGDPSAKTPELFRAMGRVIDSLGGRYITAEDMNVSPGDLLAVSETTRHVTGLPPSAGGSGNPSPVTAFGVYRGMKAVVREVFGTSSLEGRSVLVQGVGSVGARLAELCAEDGASVVTCDIDEQKVRALADRHGYRVVGNDDWADVDCDVYAPCARGGTLSNETIPRLRCRAVAGAANNQLARPEDAEALAERGIVYAPDYVINAGGIINIAVEVSPSGYRREEAMRRVAAIEQTVTEVLAIARMEGTTPAAAADRLAERRLAEARAARAS